MGAALLFAGASYLCRMLCADSLGRCLPGLFVLASCSSSMTVYKMSLSPLLIE